MTARLRRQHVALVAACGLALATGGCAGGVVYEPTAQLPAAGDSTDGTGDGGTGGTPQPTVDDGLDHDVEPDDLTAGGRYEAAALPRAALAGRDLTGADLTVADLEGADLSGAILVDAFLTAANLRGASLAGADLTRADLSGADLEGADLTDAILDGTTWNDVICPDGTRSAVEDGTCDGHR